MAKVRLEVTKGQAIGGLDLEIGSDIEVLGVRDMVSSNKNFFFLLTIV